MLPFGRGEAESTRGDFSYNSRLRKVQFRILRDVFIIHISLQISASKSFPSLRTGNKKHCLVSPLAKCSWKHSGVQRSCDPPAPGSSCGSRRPLPCRGAPSPHTSPRSALGSSPGRLSAEPGRRQSPCPGTQPLGHSRDPALHNRNGYLHLDWVFFPEKETQNVCSLICNEMSQSQ